MRSNQYIDAQGNRKPDAPEGQNQFTTGKRTRHDEQTKAKIRATFAADKLEAYLNGETELDSSKVAACKILIDKGMPSLQAVESTTRSETDEMSEEELKDYVRALISSHPELIREFAPGPQEVESSSADAPNGANAQKIGNCA